MRTATEIIAVEVLATTKDDDAALVIERLLNELQSMREVATHATALTHEQSQAIAKKDEQIALLREELRKVWEAPADREGTALTVGRDGTLPPDQ